MEGGGLLGCWGRGEQRLRVAGEVLRAVGGVEAFGEDDDFGAFGGGGEDLCARIGEVGGFVGACEDVLVLCLGRGEGAAYRLPAARGQA